MLFFGSNQTLCSCAGTSTTLTLESSSTETRGRPWSVADLFVSQKNGFGTELLGILGIQVFVSEIIIL